MNFNQYTTLHQEQQLEIVWANGFIINTRNDTHYFYMLYQLGLFFVELRYFKKLFHGLALFETMKDCGDYKK